MSFIFSVIAKDRDIILVSYSEYSGNFEQNTIILLKHVKSESRVTIEYGEYNFHYINQKSLTFMCMVKSDYPKKASFCYLDELIESFYQRYSIDEISNSKAYQFQKEFENIIREKQQNYNVNMEKEDQIQKLKEYVKEYARNVVEAEEQLTQRGEFLKKMQIKVEKFSSESRNYYKSSKKVIRNVKTSKWKIYIFVILVLALIGYFVSVAICGWAYSRC